MALTLGEHRYLFISGTASIDDHGATVCLDDFDAQTTQTIEAIAALLEGAGATLGDIRQATSFVKRPEDLAAYDRLAARAGLDRVPAVVRRRRCVPRQPARRNRCHGRRPGRNARDAAVKTTTAGVALALAVAVVGSAAGMATRSDSAPNGVRSAGHARVPGDKTFPARFPLVVSQVPLSALSGDALADGTLRRLPGEGGRLVLVDARGRARVLTRGFDSAADPEVSFDGQRVLFAGRQNKGDPWCAWEMKVDGTGLHRITCGATGVRQPIYQPTIFTITATNVEPWVQVAFAGENPGERNEAGVSANSSLWSCKTDGTALRRLTHNLSNDMDPVVLPDGRMIYAGWLAPSELARAAGPRRPARREHRRHRLPDLRRWPRAARQAVAHGDGRRIGRLRGGRSDRRRRRRPPGVRRTAPAPPHVSFAQRRGRRALSGADRPARRRRARCVAARRKGTLRRVSVRSVDRRPRQAPRRSPVAHDSGEAGRGARRNRMPARASSRTRTPPEPCSPSTSASTTSAAGGRAGRQEPSASSRACPRRRTAPPARSCSASSRSRATGRTRSRCRPTSLSNCSCSMATGSRCGRRRGSGCATTPHRAASGATRTPSARHRTA